MKTTFSTLVLIFCVSLLSYGQNCESELYRSFDFWLGEWEVVDSTGKKLGENVIRKIEGGCIVEEHWVGATGVTGSSWNYVDADSTWNQIWIDAQGSVLKIKGGLEEGSMVMRSEYDELTGEADQVTWTPQKDGSVIQHWIRINRSAELISSSFYGIYRKKE